MFPLTLSQAIGRGPQDVYSAFFQEEVIRSNWSSNQPASRHSSQTLLPTKLQSGLVLPFNESWFDLLKSTSAAGSSDDMCVRRANATRL